jgi:TIGR03009 family protein
MVVVMIAASAAFAQNDGLAKVLRDWKQATDDLKSFTCNVQRSSLDRALAARDEYKGYAAFTRLNAKPDGVRLFLELRKVGKSDDAMEKAIFTGTDIHVHDFANKVVRIYKLPKGKDAVPRQMPLSLLLNSARAAAQFDLTLVEPRAPDKHYHYILVKPRHDEDKSEFTEARVSLYKSSHLPAQIWYVQPNRTEVTWSFNDWRVNPKKALPPAMFAPMAPAGWQVINIPAPPPNKQ